MPLAAAPAGSTLIRAALVAGVVAGLLLGAFHLAVSERFVDRAITLEEQAQERELAATGATDERHEDLFSRRTQKAGLLVGTFIYGCGAGALFAGAYALFAAKLPGRTQRTRVALFTAGVIVAIVLIPFLKYPAYPPGVGDPGTLAGRQLRYIGCLLLSVAGLVLSARLCRWLRPRSAHRAALAGAGAFFVAWAAALLLLLPDRTDAVTAPDRLLTQFQAASLAGQILFWTLFGSLFATLLSRGEGPIDAAEG